LPICAQPTICTFSVVGRVPSRGAQPSTSCGPRHPVPPHQPSTLNHQLPHVPSNPSRFPLKLSKNVSRHPQPSNANCGDPSDFRPSDFCPFRWQNLTKPRLKSPKPRKRWLFRVDSGKPSLAHEIYNSLIFNILRRRKALQRWVRLGNFASPSDRVSLGHLTPDLWHLPFLPHSASVPSFLTPDTPHPALPVPRFAFLRSFNRHAKDTNSPVVTRQWHLKTPQICRQVDGQLNQPLRFSTLSHAALIGKPWLVKS